VFFTTPRSPFCLLRRDAAFGNVLGTPDFSPACVMFSPCSLCFLCEPCFLIFGTNENRGIAPSRKEEALTPRCPWGNRGVSVFYDPAIPLLSFTPRCCVWERPGNAGLKSGRCYVLSVLSVFSVRTLFFELWNERKPGYRTVAKRRGAYAAMPVG